MAFAADDESDDSENPRPISWKEFPAWQVASSMMA
jgi:hypothetical protein